MSRAVSVLTYLLVSGCGFCQSFPSIPSPDADAYGVFFRQVARFVYWQNKISMSVVPGSPADLSQYSLNDALGLTQREVNLLTSVATDCESKTQAIDSASGHLILEYRLRLLASKADQEAAQHLQELNDERRRIVLAHVQQIRDGFGESRFRLIDDFLHSGKTLVPFLPLPEVRRATHADDERQR